MALKSIDRREAMNQWAEAITRLNAVENEYDRLFWFQVFAKRRLKDHLACLRMECRIAGQVYRSLEKEWREKGAE